MSSELQALYRRRFTEALDDAAKLFLSKIPDYEDDNTPLRTFRLSADVGVEPWRGCLIRMGDKMSLLYTFVREGKYRTHNEGVTETLLDVIVYAALTRVLYDLKDELPALSIETLLSDIRSASSAPTTPSIRKGDEVR